MALEYIEISSRYHGPRTCNDRERIAFRRLMRKRNHKKRHSVNKEKSYLDRTKAAEAKKRIKEQADSMRAFNALARAYWTGAADVHP